MALRMVGSPEDRKQKIARATCRAIIELGLHRMNLRDIARALGTTTGPLQHYFRSKEELLLYTKNLLVDELLNNAREAGNKHRGGERLRIVCEHLLPFTESARMAWLVLTAFNGRAIGDERLTAIQLSRYTKCRQFFETEITLAKDAGVVDASIEPALEAIALASFVDGLAVLVLFLSKAEAKRAQVELVRRYLQRSFGITGKPLGNARGAIAGGANAGGAIARDTNPRGTYVRGRRGIAVGEQGIRRLSVVSRRARKSQ